MHTGAAVRCWDGGVRLASAEDSRLMSNDSFLALPKIDLASIIFLKGRVLLSGSCSK